MVVDFYSRFTIMTVSRQFSVNVLCLLIEFESANLPFSGVFTRRNLFGFQGIFCFPNWIASCKNGSIEQHSFVPAFNEWAKCLLSSELKIENVN